MWGTGWWDVELSTRESVQLSIRTTVFYSKFSLIVFYPEYQEDSGDAEGNEGGLHQSKKPKKEKMQGNRQ